MLSPSQGNGWQHDRDKFQAFADASLEMAEACLCTARKYKRGGPTGVQAVESQEMQQTPEKQEGKDVLRWLASTRMHLRSIVKQVWGCSCPVSYARAPLTEFLLAPVCCPYCKAY